MGKLTWPEEGPHRQRHRLSVSDKDGAAEKVSGRGQAEAMLGDLDPTSSSSL